MIQVLLWSWVLAVAVTSLALLVVVAAQGLVRLLRTRRAGRRDRAGLPLRLGRAHVQAARLSSE